MIHNSSQKGQVLLLSVLVLSGIIVSVSFFVGYLTVQRLKQAIISVDSAQAFYLSDAGIEYELYRRNLEKGDFNSPCPDFNGKLPANSGFRTSVTVNGDYNKDASVGLEIKSMGGISYDDFSRSYKVSRSQKDNSYSILAGICAEKSQYCASEDKICQN